MIFIFGCSKATESVFVGPSEDIAEMKVVAVLPFANYTTFPDAGDTVASAFAHGIVDSPIGIRVLMYTKIMHWLAQEPMEIPKVIDRPLAVRLGRLLKIDGVFIGSITEYSYRHPSAEIQGDPAISLNLRLIGARSGSVVWAGSFSRGFKGDMSLRLLTETLVKEAAMELGAALSDARDQ